MTLQRKMSEENIAKKKYEFKFGFIWNLQKMFLFLVSVLPLEKCSRCRIYFSDFIDIYMSYIKIF